MSVTLLVVDIFLQSILYVTDGDYMEENRLRLFGSLFVLDGGFEFGESIKLNQATSSIYMKCTSRDAIWPKRAI